MLPSGDVYVGSFVQHKRSGRGMLTTPAGDSFDGEWEDGKLHGAGEWLSAAGSSYSGESVRATILPRLICVRDRTSRLPFLPPLRALRHVRRAGSLAPPAGGTRPLAARRAR